MGNHATEPGFSGRAINGENLYSLNRGLSMGEQHGVMISNMVKDITLFVPEFHQQGARLEFLVDHSIFSDHLSIFSDFAPSYGVIPYSKFKDAINNVSHNQWLDQKKEGSQKVFHIYDDPSKCGRYFNNPYELHLTVILDPNSDWVKKFHFTLREKGREDRSYDAQIFYELPKETNQNGTFVSLSEPSVMNRAQLLDKNSELFEKALRSDPDKAKEYNKLKKAGDESEVYTFKTKLYSELFMKDLYGNLLPCPRSDSNKSLFF